jgi:hypothetical protein
VAGRGGTEGSVVDHPNNSGTTQGGIGGNSNAHFGAGRTAATAGPRFTCTGASDCTGCNSDAGQRFAAALGGRSTTDNGPDLASCLRVPPEQAMTARGAPIVAGPPPPGEHVRPRLQALPGEPHEPRHAPEGTWALDRRRMSIP